VLLLWPKVFTVLRAMRVSPTTSSRDAQKKEGE
jgi:hypothetical protein